MANFQTKKGPKITKNCHNSNLHYQLLNHKLSLNNNKRAMLWSLGGGQIKKKQHKHDDGQSQSFENNNK